MNRVGLMLFVIHYIIHIYFLLLRFKTIPDETEPVNVFNQEEFCKYDTTINDYFRNINITV